MQGYGTPVVDGHALIVIGASTGGLSALRILFAGLSPTIPAAICVVQHIGDHASRLPELLNGVGPLPVMQAQDGDGLKAGCIYIAPPAHHLVIGPGCLHLTRGPRENFARPAIDPLFRSAAEYYGSRAIGVVLTGQLNDGTAGLYEIKRRGGISVVQEPSDAESSGMPQSAIDYVPVDHCVAVSAMPTLLNELAVLIRDRGASRKVPLMETKNLNQKLPRERPIAFTCPECGGALRRSDLGALVKFDCHIGHSMTVEAMAAGQFSEMEKGFEMALRRMNERIELCQGMTEKAHASGDEHQARRWQTAMLQTEDRAKGIIDLVEASWMQPQDGNLG